MESYLPEQESYAVNIYFQGESEGLPGYFIIGARCEQFSQNIHPGSKQFVLYHAYIEKKWAEALPSKQEIKISSYSLSVGHGHDQHAGVAWKGSNILREHTS